MNDEPTDGSLIENVSALSAVFHKDDRYEEFYDMYAMQLSGFPGIWTFISWAGQAFTQVERQMKVQWDGEWIECIEAFSDAIYRNALTDGPVGNIQNLSLLRQWARPIICTYTQQRRELHA